MRLDAITLEHFRNYAHQSVTFDPSVNVIVGENAQGKTNLLEAAVYLSCAKSPRARTEKEMISFDADTARLTGSVFSRGRDFTVEIELSRGKRRKMSVNQVPCKRAGDLSGVLNSSISAPTISCSSATAPRQGGASWTSRSLSSARATTRR